MAKPGSNLLTLVVPWVECYEMCVKGWDQYFKSSLRELITTGKGQPQLRRKVEA
ncbi:MAG: hypothetical protein ACTHML_15550 [Ginsengibacter sp.]